MPVAVALDPDTPEDSADARLARGVSVNRCPNPGCPCGSLIVRMHDEHGRVLAGAVLPKAVAALFAAQVAALTGPNASTDLSVIRCQGVA